MPNAKRAEAHPDQPVLFLAEELAQLARKIASGPLSCIAELRARAAILDVIACMIAGRNERAVHAVRETVRGWGDGRAGLVGEHARISAPFAALVNGTAAHVLDFDDNFFPAISHGSAVLVPALLALGEERDADLIDLLPAYIAGLEVQAILGERINPEHYELGWHATSTLGTIGAAAASGILLRLPVQRLRNALSLAASLASGSKKQFGTSAKPVHAGYAAMHGVLAAKLAEAGVDASADIFEGPWGFLTQFTQGRPSMPQPIGDRDQLHIERQGVTAKLYPSCMSSHLGIDGVLALREKPGFNAGDISAIEIAMPAFMIANLRFPRPETREQARFSMHYCAAVAAIDGAPRLHHFTAREIARLDLVALAEKVRMIPRAASLEAAGLPWGGDAEVTIRTEAGRSQTVRIAYPKGSHGYPMTEAEQAQKFRDCCEGHVPRDGASAIYEIVRHLGHTLPVRQISAFLSGGA